VGYIFDPQELHRLAQSVVGRPLPEMVETIGSELERRYPRFILKKREWVFNNAGGAMGQMLIFHASLTEYLLIFGSNNGTEGATGRFAADDYFMMLEGEHWCYGEGTFEREVTKPGGVAMLRRGDAKAYRLPDRAYALEYARGYIPLMLPFGFADTFSSTLDFGPLWRTTKTYTRGVLSSLLRGKI
jgi:C-8 sterol isomerase